MSGHARQAVVDLEADNHFDSDHKQMSLHNGNPDAEIHSENDHRRMSQLGQPIELPNGNEPRGYSRIPTCAAGPTESNSNRHEEQQNQFPSGREPRRWISKTEWTNYIQEDPRCPHLRNRPSSVVSIFRVPNFLKDTKKEAYVPQRVSLGLYHHGSAELPAMGHHKGRALRRMMKRFKANTNLPVVPNNMDFADRAMGEILKLESEIRDSYEENIDCNGEDLARVLSLDGCFLLEVLRILCGEKLSREEAENCYDPIFGKNKLGFAASDIVNDILILENQIPSIVLLKLLELELNCTADALMRLDYLMKVTLHWSNPFDDKKMDIRQWSCHHHRHLLGFLHAVIASPPSSSQGERVDQGECSISTDCCSRKCILILRGKSNEWKDAQRIPHAVELRNAGIKFSPLLQGGIEQIKFDENNATIFLPPISIDDRTERVFRNLIAYEMCKPSQINYVCCYVALMNDLIDTEQDVALMRRRSVMSNSLGSDKEVADLFNCPGKDVTAGMNAVFDNLTEKVNAHYNNEMKVQIGKLVQDHFSSPWKACALTAASVILLLTVLQTICTRL